MYYRYDIIKYNCILFAVNLIRFLKKKKLRCPHSIHKANGNESILEIAQKFGIRVSLIFARILDLVALVLLVLLGYLMELSFTYYIGIMISIGFLLYKHLIISAENLSRFGPSFFRINAYVSISIFMGTLVSIIV